MNGNEPLLLEKRAMRSRILKMLRSMPLETRLKNGADVVRRIGERVAVWQPRKILAYLPMPHELPLDPLIEQWHARGIEVYVPGACEPGGLLVWWRWTPYVPLIEDRYGIRVPDADAPALEWLADGERIDLMIVPGIAFDRHGGRMGYGGGFYDRWLREHRESCPHVIGAGLDFQEVDQVPAEVWDQRIGWLITGQTDQSCG